MKKAVVGIIIIIGLVGVMVFTLFHNKAEADLKASQTMKQQAVTVSTMLMKPQSLDYTYTKTGSIAASNEVSVVAMASGKIVNVYCQVGQRVGRGTPLFKINDASLVASLNSTRTAYQIAQRDWERAVQLHNEHVISDSDLETYQTTLQTDKASYATAQQNYNYATITSPITGIVTDRAADLGTTVTSGTTTVATVVDDSSYKITVNVPEQQAFQIKLGDSVKLQTDVYPGETLYGKISNISEKSDSVHTFPVEVAIPRDAKHPLKSGVFANVIFDLGMQNNVLAIPRSALVGSVKNAQVYVVENGVAKLRNIAVLDELGTQLVVTKGLNENDQVVITGQNNLEDNDTVKIINSK